MPKILKTCQLMEVLQGALDTLDNVVVDQTIEVSIKRANTMEIDGATIEIAPLLMKS